MVHILVPTRMTILPCIALGPWVIIICGAAIAMPPPRMCGAIMLTHTATHTAAHIETRPCKYAHMHTDNPPQSCSPQVTAPHKNRVTTQFNASPPFVHCSWTRVPLASPWAPRTKIRPFKQRTPHHDTATKTRGFLEKSTHLMNISNDS